MRRIRRSVQYTEAGTEGQMNSVLKLKSTERENELGQIQSDLQKINTLAADKHL